jgi:predicted ABC-type sugar transport system permease subunit
VGVITTYDDKKDLILFSRDGLPVDQYIELGGNYVAADGKSYQFSGTKVRAQFNTYQVLRLKQSYGVTLVVVVSVIIVVLVTAILLRWRSLLRRTVRD